MVSVNNAERQAAPIMVETSVDGDISAGRVGVVALRLGLDQLDSDLNHLQGRS